MKVLIDKHLIYMQVHTKILYHLKDITIKEDKIR